MKKFKKIIATMTAMTTIAVGMTGVGASAASWEASHVNEPGAPGSASTSPSVVVSHKAAGADAVCNTNIHSNSTATTGTTYIDCATYTMAQKSIVKTGSVVCNPNVGAPIVDVSVTYKVSAYTPTSSDVFWSKGNITKK